MKRIRDPRLTILVVLACRLLVACGDSGGNAPVADQAELTAPGPYAIGTRDLTFVDTSRPTPPNGSYPGAPSRTLPTRVWYPVDPTPSTSAGTAGVGLPPASGGPFPVVAYAHGYLANNLSGAPFGEHLASHGYVVVAPTFPLSNGGAPGGPTFADVANQPGDLAFSVQAVAALGGEDRPIAASMDLSRQGILGLSLGGGTVLIATYHPTLHLNGIKAAVAQAPASCFFGTDFFVQSVPTLIMGGSSDLLVPFTDSDQHSFMLAPPPVTLLELIGGTHVGFIGIDVPGAVNSDRTVGCGAVESAGMSGINDLITALTENGTDPGAVDAGNCNAFCSDNFAQTMSATRQLELARAATLAHFDSVLRGRADARRYLTDAIGTINSDARVSVKQ